MLIEENPVPHGSTTWHHRRIARVSVIWTHRHSICCCSGPTICKNMMNMKKENSAILIAGGYKILHNHNVTNVYEYLKSKVLFPVISHCRLGRGGL